MSTLRERFEKWFSDDGKWPAAVKRIGDGYKMGTAQGAWSAWQACSEALAKTSPTVALRDAAQAAIPVLRSAAGYLNSHGEDRRIDEQCRTAADGLQTALAEPAEQPAYEPLTQAEMLALVLSLTHGSLSTYPAFCYESGPYNVTKLLPESIALIRAVERAVLKKIGGAK